MKKLNRRTRVLILTIVIAVLLLAVYAAGLLIPDSYVASSMMEKNLPPSFVHPFGTDSLGRDLF